ncbi:hypothetical protein BJX62DRAFT_207542 [Aspergillus germanicus]
MPLLLFLVHRAALGIFDFAPCAPFWNYSREGKFKVFVWDNNLMNRRLQYVMCNALNLLDLYSRSDGVIRNANVEAEIPEKQSRCCGIRSGESHVMRRYCGGRMFKNSNSAIG